MDAMEVVAFLLAETARDNGDGTVTLTRAPLSRFAPDSYPVQPRVPVVIIMEGLPNSEPSSVALTVTVRTGEGEPVGEHFEGVLSLPAWGPNAPLGLPIYAPTVLPLTLELNAPGTYTVALLVDGVEAATCVFMAAPAPDVPAATS